MAQKIATPWGIGILVVIAVGIAVFFIGSADKKEDTLVDAKVKRMQTHEEVIIRTNHGDIEIKLFGQVAPQTVNNFLTLAQDGFYDGTKFHRIIKDFMIQGGDPLSKDDSQKDRWGTGGPGYTFDDEINEHKVVRGALAMANAGPNTNGSQFFIVTTEKAPWLDGKHTVFGEVTKGMNVVDNIEAVETDTNDQPVKPVVVEEVVLK